MEAEGSLSHSQEPATCPYPEPYQSFYFFTHLKENFDFVFPSSYIPDAF
jgi:hypothetical protein